MILDRIITLGTCLSVGLLVSIGLTTTPAGAAIIIEAVDTPSASEGPAPGDLGTANLGDTFNNSFGDTGTTGGGASARVGAKLSNNEERRAVAEFDIGSLTSGDVTANPTITVEFDVAAINGSPNFTFGAFLNTAETNENGNITGSDFFYASEAQLPETYVANALTVGGTISFTLSTAQLLAELGESDNFLGIQVRATTTLPTGTSGDPVDVTFDEARLVFVPEPASIALMLVGLGLVVPRRRRD